MWVATWLFNWQLWLNVRSHISHANGFSSCLAASWLFKLQLWLNIRSHNWHANGFTPCLSLHDSSSENCGWMLDHIFHMQMASLTCGSLHDSSSDNCEWMMHHIFLMQMPSLHVGHYMTLKLTTVVECKITYFTCKWLHSHVGLFMTPQVTIVDECCITCLTCKCLHSMRVSSWLFKWQLWMNAASHLSHTKAFTPCGSLHDSSTDNCGWMIDHNFTCKWLLFLLGCIMTLQVTTAVEC